MADEPDDEQPEVIDYSSMESMELAAKEAEVKQELLRLGEFTKMNPTTQRARDLHSQRAAIRIELRRRGLR